MYFSWCVVSEKNFRLRVSDNFQTTFESPPNIFLPLTSKKLALLDSSELLTADGRGVGDEEDDGHFIGWVFRNAAREAGVLAPTYESACIIMYVSRGNSERCAVDSHLWNNGANHVMVDFGDTGR